MAQTPSAPRRTAGDEAALDGSGHPPKIRVQFIGSGRAINTGFFQNVGRTQREGFELGLGAKLGPVTLEARYGFLRATFRTPFRASSPQNSSADANGNVAVEAGDEIPGLPRNTFKLRADADLGGGFTAGANVRWASGQFARGDESNSDVHGRIPGYTIVDIDARYRLGPRWDLFLSLDNALGKDYETFGVLGENAFRGPNGTFDITRATPEQFRSSGAPRGLWIGVECRLGGGDGEGAAGLDD